MINIENLMQMGGSVRVEVTPEDLRMFAESVVERTIVARDRQAELEASKEETYISKKEARQLLGVCEGTLITWAKRGNLVPVKVGNKNRYAMSDIRRIQTGKRSESVTEYCKRRNTNCVYRINVISSYFLFYHKGNTLMYHFMRQQLFLIIFYGVPQNASPLK